jgi:hypothetical protein
MLNSSLLSRFTYSSAVRCNFELIYVCSQMVQAFTHGPVKLEAWKDGKFELFGGNICGVFVELVRKGPELCGKRCKVQSFGTKQVD